MSGRERGVYIGKADQDDVHRQESCEMCRPETESHKGERMTTGCLALLCECEPSKGGKRACWVYFAGLVLSRSLRSLACFLVVEVNDLTEMKVQKKKTS